MSDRPAQLGNRNATPRRRRSSPSRVGLLTLREDRRWGTDPTEPRHRVIRCAGCWRRRRSSRRVLDVRGSNLSSSACASVPSRNTRIGQAPVVGRVSKSYAFRALVIEDAGRDGVILPHLRALIVACLKSALPGTRAGTRLLIYFKSRIRQSIVGPMSTRNPRRDWKGRSSRSGRQLIERERAWIPAVSCGQLPVVGDSGVTALDSGAAVVSPDRGARGGRRGGVRAGRASMGRCRRVSCSDCLAGLAQTDRMPTSRVDQTLGSGDCCGDLHGRSLRRGMA